MIAQNKEYRDAMDLMTKVQDKELNKVLEFGKYKGLTIKDVMIRDRQYVKWLIRETPFEIDPLTIGLKFPTKEDLLEATKGKAYSAELVEDGVAVTNWYHKDAVIDHWGLQPRVLFSEKNSYDTNIYSFESAYKCAINTLKAKFAFIPWTFEYYKEILLSE